MYPLWETINELKVPVMIDVGTTGMGAGMPGGLGAVIRHAHPAAIDRLAADFPNLNIVAAHPGWPWTDEMLAVALHKGNVSWELSGWAPKYFPDALKRDIKGRLKDKVMFGSDYPSIPYERIFREWQELDYSDELMEKIYHQNAERVLGLKSCSICRINFAAAVTVLRRCAGAQRRLTRHRVEAALTRPESSPRGYRRCR